MSNSRPESNTQHQTSVFRFLVSALYPFRLYLVALVFILLVYSGNLFVKTQLIKTLVDAVTRPSTSVYALWTILGYFGIVFLVELLTHRLQEWCTLQYEPALQGHITASIFKHVLQREYRFFQSSLTGNLAAKVHDVTTCIPAILAIFLYDYFVNFLLIVVAFIALWQVSAWLSLFVMVWSFWAILIATFTTRRSLDLASHTAEATAQTKGYVIDAFNNLLTTRLFSGQAHTLRRLNKLQTGYLKSRQRYAWFMLKFYTLQGASFQLYQGICLLFLIRMYSQSTVTAGEFAMIVSTNFIITENLWKMFERMQALNTLWGKVSRGLQVLLAPPLIQDKPHAAALVAPEGTIRFENVTFGYTRDATLFHQQTVHIAAKQRVGLVGYSGSGKTTFIHLIARLFDVDGGAILIDGQNIRDVTQETLHKAITVVTQESLLFYNTILENIRYGNPNATDLEVIEAAKRACAHAFIMQLPQQYKTHVGTQGLCLSGGQKQRIAIARALLTDAPVVLLDEVTAHLDTATEQALTVSLEACLRDKTVLTASHKLTTLQQMDRILVFDNGKIVEDGPHHQLLVQGGHYATLWKRGNRRSNVVTT